MKKSYTLLMATALMVWAPGIARSAVLLEDNFDYPAGELIIDHNWDIRANQNIPVGVAAGSLSFAGYPLSDIGNAAQINGPSNESDGRDFTVQNSGSIYASFLLNVAAIDAQATQYTHFFSFGATPTFSVGRFHVNAGADPEQLTFGIQKLNEPLVTAASTFAVNTTYLVVMKYTIVDGDNNDEVRLFVLPPGTQIPAAEPAPNALVSDAPLQSDPSQYSTGVLGVRLHQVSANNNVVIDGVRVATTWEELFGNSPATTTTTDTTTTTSTLEPSTTTTEAATTTSTLEPSTTTTEAATTTSTLEPSTTTTEAATTTSTLEPSTTTTEAATTTSTLEPSTTTTEAVTTTTLEPSTTTTEAVTTTTLEPSTTTTEAVTTTTSTSTAVSTTTTTLPQAFEDTDDDGVADPFDKCPDTPAGTLTFANGCPAPPLLLNTALHLHKGWNLIGLKGALALGVADVVGANSDQIISVWKWVCSASDVCNWAVTLPSYSASQSVQYAFSKGFSLLTALEPGEGFWVNATGPVDLDATNYETTGMDAQDAGALLFGQLCQDCHQADLSTLVGASAPLIEDSFVSALAVKEHLLTLSAQKIEVLAAFLTTANHSDDWKKPYFHGAFVTASSTQPCIPCHGTDLQGGGTAQISCYSCHQLTP